MTSPTDAQIHRAAIALHQQRLGRAGGVRWEQLSEAERRMTLGDAVAALAAAASVAPAPQGAVPAA